MQNQKSKFDREKQKLQEKQRNSRKSYLKREGRIIRRQKSFRQIGGG